MNCEFCGSSIPAGAANCPACGAACAQPQPANQQTQTAAGTERICVFCGAIIADPNAKECPKCHFSIACKCGKVFKSPRAVCSQCKQETAAFYEVREHMRPAEMKAELEKNSVKCVVPGSLGCLFFVAGFGILLSIVFKIDLGLGFKGNAAEIIAAVAIFVSCCLFGLIGTIDKKVEKKVEKKYPEFQTTLKMLKEDKAFFQAQFQKYLAAERAKAETDDED